MRGVIVHGILLVVMLGFGYQTWTRDKTIRVNTGDVSIWDGSTGDLTAVEYGISSSVKMISISRIISAAMERSG